MAYKNVENLAIADARIIFRNFSGREMKYNPKGNRNFCVVIDDERQAEKMAEEGWNVRIWTPKEEGAEAIHYMKVGIRYDVYPPKIVLVTRRKKTVLDEENVGDLDFAEIRNVDLVVRPYNWETADASGIKAYVKNMYVTIEEDVFADKYAEEEYPEE